MKKFFLSLGRQLPSSSPSAPGARFLLSFIMDDCHLISLAIILKLCGELKQAPRFFFPLPETAYERRECGEDVIVF